MNSVVELIRQLREKGWGDSDLGDAFGVDRVTIYRWRMGERKPEAEKMVIDSLRRLLRRAGPPRRRRNPPGSRDPRGENEPT
jgi:hypothetical protein